MDVRVPPKDQCHEDHPVQHAPVRPRAAAPRGSRRPGRGAVMSLARTGRMQPNDFRPRSRPIKAVVDRAVAALALLVAAPWLAVIALAIWIDSPGPILSREKRVGQWGETFELLRFRSTFSATGTARPGRGAGQVLTGPTRVGAVLRRCSLHE